MLHEWHGNCSPFTSATHQLDWTEQLWRPSTLLVYLVFSVWLRPATGRVVLYIISTWEELRWIPLFQVLLCPPENTLQTWNSSRHEEAGSMGTCCEACSYVNIDWTSGKDVCFHDGPSADIVINGWGEETRLRHNACCQRAYWCMLVMQAHGRSTLSMSLWSEAHRGKRHQEAARTKIKDNFNVSVRHVIYVDVPRGWHPH